MRRLILSASWKVISESERSFNLSKENLTIWKYLIYSKSKWQKCVTIKKDIKKKLSPFNIFFNKKNQFKSLRKSNLRRISKKNHLNFFAFSGSLNFIWSLSHFVQLKRNKCFVYSFLSKFFPNCNYKVIHKN